MPTSAAYKNINILDHKDLKTTFTELGQHGHISGILTVCVVLAAWLGGGWALSLLDNFSWRPTLPPDWMRRKDESFRRRFWCAMHEKHPIWSAIVFLPSARTSRFERATLLCIGVLIELQAVQHSMDTQYVLYYGVLYYA